jgi:hypothetical protein
MWPFMVQKRVLALQHIAIDPPGYLGELLQEHSIPYDVAMVPEGALPDPAVYGAILSMGGRSTPEMRGSPTWLRKEGSFAARSTWISPSLGFAWGADAGQRAGCPDYPQGAH